MGPRVLGDTVGGALVELELVEDELLPELLAGAVVVVVLLFFAAARAVPPVFPGPAAVKRTKTKATGMANSSFRINRRTIPPPLFCL